VHASLSVKAFRQLKPTSNRISFNTLVYQVNNEPEHPFCWIFERRPHARIFIGESIEDADTATEADADEGEKGFGVESSATSKVAGTCGGGRVGDTSN